MPPRSSRSCLLPGTGRQFAKLVRVGCALSGLLCAGCDVVRTGFMNAAGPVATGERQLFLIVVGVMVVVILPVLLLAPLFAWHYRLANTHRAYRPNWSFSWPLEVLIWVPPSLIVVALAVLLWVRARQFDPYRALPSAVPALEVQAVALDWKWLFIYPQEQIATLNELDIPAGRPVHITLTSGTVMQSLFVPQLAGQIYAMAGMSTQLNFAADRPGTFIGLNTQYNGTGFSHDRFNVIALPAADYDRWLLRVRNARHPLDGTAYSGLFDRTIEVRPVLFSSVEDGLFARILARTGAEHSMTQRADRRP